MNGPGTDLRATPVLPRRGRRGDTGMIPLINIVLLLLIFFLLAGRIDDGPNRPEIRPPTSASEKSVPHPSVPHPSVIVSLDTKGRLTLNGADVSFETVVPALEFALAGDGRRVALKVDRDVTADTLDRLLDVVREQGIATVTLYSVHAEAA